MPTKAELEELLAEQEARIAELEATPEEEDDEEEEEEVKQLADASAGKDAFLAELDEYQQEIHAHRFESEAFVRAYAWARKRGNETKACLVYADAHELDFEESTEPVVKKD